MEYLSILFASLSIGFLGFLLGIILAIASKLLAVEKDEKIVKIEAVLPNVNCGVCGYPGCANYAEAIAKNGAECDLCVPGGAPVANQISEIMGLKSSSNKIITKAFVHCRGNKNISKLSHKYSGLSDCNAITMFYGGDKVCKTGCIGGGSCIKVCPVDAIYKDKNSNIVVDWNLCIGCGKCEKICPTKVIRLIDGNADVAVACNSNERGAAVKKMCPVGCIGCSLCEKKSPDSGFFIVDNLAKIDYNISGCRDEAKKICPAKCIVDIRN